jgi:transposase InsO family protein
MSALSVFPGARLVYDGDVVEVVELDGLRVTVRNHRTGQFTCVRLAALAAAGRPAGAEPGAGSSVLAGVALAGLSAGQQAEVSGRAGHVREVITGYRAGHADAALPGEPRPQYATGRPLKDRYRVKAAELGVTARTVENWVAAYRESGEAGLVDTRTLRGRGGTVDPRWDDAVREALAGLVNASTPTRGAVLARASQVLEDRHGPGVVPVPSRATAYRRLAELTKGTNAVSGSAKGRRSIADRPAGPYGRLRATRPSEYVILDTQDLDVFAMEPVTCRWVPAQLTVAQDLFSRCILGLRLTPVSTKAVDVAGVLYETVAPPQDPHPSREHDSGCYHGVPEQLVFTEAASSAGRPACPPETLVIDHGKAFLSAHVIGVCTRLGISIQPAQPKKPTDKPTVERFFKTLREGLIQYLPAYKGSDVYSRGERIEDEAFFYLHELEEIIRDWVSTVYHRTRHEGLVVPEWPRLQLSPAEMHQIGIAKAGLLRLPATPELACDFLQVEYRTIQHYGIEVGGLRYDGAVLNGYRNATSPCGGIHAGKWPVRVNPDDVRYIYFQDPADDSWHRLEWEHAALLGVPFSGEAARHARRLAARSDRWPDAGRELSELLERWDKGEVTGRRERRMAARLAAGRAAISWDEPGSEAEETPGPHAGEPQAATGPGAAWLRVVEDVTGDDDAEEEIFDDPGDFYADAFEVIE